MMGVPLPHLMMISRLAALSAASLLVFTALCNYLVARTTNESLYSNISTLPYNQVGVLLGTSKYSRVGGFNDHYRLRLDAAYRLYTAGKIDYILISGDNSTRFYDEPSTIRRDLLKKGIPSERIYRDYAGFRTLDSILRAHHVFELDSFTIISQAPHNKRALYIALNNDIDAIAYNAGEGYNSDISNKTREILARVLAVLEVHLLNTGPKFLGPPIEIGVTPPT
ncbi:vancomycin high temperature exclusion protein [Endozoicomonas sp.]|uniref:SanA/YdcF family protein n=1 Tax=Endozoicomonas sp. TaxID=1892382 RepID=UPI0028889520|nr:ElyC/SanA/YdcF family protein [Endozoicomonas sp.]